MNRIGVDIFQPIVPEYRQALFDGIAADSRFTVGIQAAESNGPVDHSVELRNMPYDYGHPLKRFGSLIWQPGFSFRYAREKGDVVVICGDIHQLSSLWLAVRAKWRGFGVVWWGHHVSANPKPLAVSIRLMIARRLADCILCYTDVGISFFVAHGFPRERVFATGNTIDIAAVDFSKGYWHAENRLDSFREKEHLVGRRILLFSSVLRRKTQLNLLVRSLPLILQRHPDSVCVVIGDGELYLPCREIAERLGVADNFRWLGAVRDQTVLAPWFLSAEVFVYPGPIGLSIVHAFAYGLPVIVNQNKANHGPEYILFEDGVNGVSFEEGNLVSLADQVCRVLAMPVENRKTLGADGQARVFQEYTMRRMVERFSEAVVACSRLKKERI